MIEYQVPSDGDFWWSMPHPGICYTNKSNYLEQLAEIAAEDYFNNHDGQDSWTGWPVSSLNFVVREDGEILGVAKVEMEYSPHFYAYVADD